MKKPHKFCLGASVAMGVIFFVNGALAETYAYDAQGRITSVTTDAGVVTYYCYDSAGNRTYVGPTSC